MAKAKKALVIGSGIAGLASACRLASKGYDVEVFEAAPSYGGKLGEFKHNGFRFDKGPSLFTLPEILDQVFIDCGKNPRDYYSYRQLELITKYFYPDETTLNAYAELEAFKQELHLKHGEDLSDLNRFFKKIEGIYNFVSPIFLENPIRSFYKYLPYGFVKSVFKSLQIGAFKSLHQSNSEQFSHPKTIQLFNRFATYNGSNPYLAPATLNVIPHLEHQIGAYFVDGGMRALATALYQLALDLKVSFNFNSPVEQILIENRKANGLLVHGQEHRADELICNMDINHAYRKLLPAIAAPKLLLSQEKSSSALVFYWSMNRTFDSLDVHNILFSNSYKQEFQKLAEGKVDDDPTVYLYISSKANQNDAPEGMENWFTMINVPYNSGQDWKEIIERSRKNILLKLNKCLGIDVSQNILHENQLDPMQIESLTSSFGGALYGNSSNNMFAAFLRHPHKNKKIANLSFVGGSTHPGGGIPLCLLSAKIACHEL